MKVLHPSLRHTIAPSPVAANRLLRAGWKPDRITVLPYFCPLEVRTEPRPLPPTPTISYIGRIAPNKGYLSFIQALGHLPDNWRGIMAGDITDGKAKELVEVADQSGCKHRLQLKPWASREEVLEIMDNTTVFVFPSLWEETLGIVALEALSRGVPVVSTDVVGVEYWLNQRDCGRSVPPNDAVAIADAVLSLTTSEAALLAAGQAGIKLIKDEFSPEVHTTKLVSIYRSAISDLL